MHSTHRNMVTNKPVLSDNSFVGRCFRSAHAMSEGGMRTKGKYKASIDGLPLVSIITVCLNSAKTIKQTIESVLSQTYTNIEYIIVDGASGDETLDIITSYEDSIDYYVSESDDGLYDAINKGIGLSTGEYILILNSDDWYTADCVESLIKAKRYSNADIISALAEYVNQEGETVEIMRSMPFDSSVRLRMPLRHETMLISAAIYDNVGPYSLDYKIISDFDFTIRAFEKNYSHYEIPRPLLYFRNTGVSNQEMNKLIDEHFKLIGSEFPFLDEKAIILLSQAGKMLPGDFIALAENNKNQLKLVNSLRAYFDYQKSFIKASHWHEAGTDFPVWEDQQPCVSVILPVYNGHKTLHNCFESIKNQSLKNIEIICVNDASIDDTQSIIDEYMKSDSRIISLINKDNCGQGASRNYGASHASGEYIFYLDSDDTILPTALEILYENAKNYPADMIKGSFVSKQIIHGRKSPEYQIKNVLPSDMLPVLDSNLLKMQALLNTTEGHWSYLYKSEFAKRVRYPVDLKIGEDSIFLIRALCLAKSVNVIDTVVYSYLENDSSVMNTFNYEKFMDALDWRLRAFAVLKDAGHPNIGERMLQAYWSENFFKNMGTILNEEEILHFFSRLSEALIETGLQDLPHNTQPYVKELLSLVVIGKLQKVHEIITAGKKKNYIDLTLLEPECRQISEKAKSIKVATFCTFDHGGAGTGTQRRVKALRKYGIDAKIYSLIVKSSHDYVNQLIPDQKGIEKAAHEEIWNHIADNAVITRHNTEGFIANELFSRTDSVISYSNLEKIFDDMDILHLHWIVGMLDYEYLGKHFADQPIVWTLADMNAFTGSCHYSEGCNEFKNECKKCPLINADQQVTHENWKVKKKAYQKLNNLHIICPSKWMADRARESSLLGDKPIYYLPNAYPVEEFIAYDKGEARKRLGLPQDKKLLIFGAETLNSNRKGWEILQYAMLHLEKWGKLKDVEIILFGNSELDLPVKTHPLGYVSGNENISLAYSAADAFLFPSREDNAPLTVVESLLCGTPVVAAPVGHVPDVIIDGETGYIAEYGDVRSFATGIEWILKSDKETALKRSEKCVEIARAYFDPELAAKRHEAIYLKALQLSSE